MMRIDKTSIVMALGGCWLFSLCLKLLYLHLAYPNGVMLETYNFFIDYIPGIVIGGAIICMSWVKVLKWIRRDGAPRRPVLRDEARSVRVPAIPLCGVTDTCHPGTRAVRASDSKPSLRPPVRDLREIPYGVDLSKGETQ